MKQAFIIISNGFGGIETYENNIIKFLENENKDVYCIGKKTNKINKKKIYCNVLYRPINVLNYILSIKKKGYDEIIFLISNPLILIIYFFLIKFNFKRKKIILTIHSHIFNLSIKQRIIGLITSILINYIDNVIFVSHFTKNWWLENFALCKRSKYKVIHNFIFHPKKIKKMNNFFNIGFVGRIDQEKGVEKFINISNKFQDPKIKFLLFGNKNNKLKNNNIKLYGWKNKNFIYNKIHLLLLTSPIENCPYSVLESKSHGIPTLTISNGGVKEIIKDNNDGMLLKQNASIEEIIKNIKYIKKNYKYFSKNCLLNYKKYEYIKNKKKLINIFLYKVS